jgi:hypothetical protein
MNILCVVRIVLECAWCTCMLRVRMYCVTPKHSTHEINQVTLIDSEISMICHIQTRKEHSTCKNVLCHTRAQYGRDQQGGAVQCTIDYIVSTVTQHQGCRLCPFPVTVTGFGYWTSGHPATIGHALLLAPYVTDLHMLRLYIQP